MLESARQFYAAASMICIAPGEACPYNLKRRNHVLHSGTIKLRSARFGRETHEPENRTSPPHGACSGRGRHGRSRVPGAGDRAKQVRDMARAVALAARQQFVQGQPRASKEHARQAHRRTPQARAFRSRLAVRCHGDVRRREARRDPDGHDLAGLHPRRRDARGHCQRPAECISGRLGGGLLLQACRLRGHDPQGNAREAWRLLLDRQGLLDRTGREEGSEDASRL